MTADASPTSAASIGVRVSSCANDTAPNTFSSAWPGKPAHIAASVAEYVQKLQGRLELDFLPGYAPELNPDEFV